MADFVNSLRQTFTFENLSGAAFGAAAGATIIPAFLSNDVPASAVISIPLYGGVVVDKLTMSALIGGFSKIFIDLLAYRFLQKGERGQLRQRDSLVLHVLGSGVAYALVPALLQQGALPNEKMMRMLFSAGLVGGYASQSLSEELTDVFADDA